MKTLSKAILMLLIFVPLSLNAAPAKKPGMNKGKKNKQTAVVVKGKKGKKGKKGPAVVVVKGKKGKPVVVGRKHRRGRRERRVELLLSGRSWMSGPRAVYVSTMSDLSFRRLTRRLATAPGERARLRILERAAGERHFTVRQARIILRQFRSERRRLQALEVMRYSIVDQYRFHELLMAFGNPGSRHEAALILAGV